MLSSISLFGLAILSWMLIGQVSACSEPATINVRRFTLVIQHAWIKGKTTVTANGTVPGPLLDVNQGDYVIVDVYNAMSNVSTTVHWHGMFQHLTPESDGVLGLSQCPIAPGDHHTYRFTAAPYGTFWYHGHSHGQYTDGLYGPLIINRAGGEVHQYQDDATIMIADWYKLPFGDMLPWFLSNVSNSNEPLPDVISLNGVFSQQLSIPASRQRVLRLRFINTAAFSMYRVSVDGLPLQVIEIDGAATQAYEIDRIQINVAQRVSVLLNFTLLQNISSTENAIYIRIEPAIEMYAVPYQEFQPDYNVNYTFDPLALAIITLDQVDAVPSYTDAPVITTQHTMTSDANMLDVRPYDFLVVPDATTLVQINVTFVPNDINEVRAYFNDINFNTSYWETAVVQPVLFQAAQDPTLLGSTRPGLVTYNSAVGTYNFQYGDVVELTIFNFDGGEHPFHLHGTSVWVIATSSYPEAADLYSGSWLQRDVISVPPADTETNPDTNETTTTPGWARVRFISNNPGIWMFHCHIEWHMAQGLATWFAMGPDYLPVLNVPSADHARVCANYATYANTQ